MLSAAAHWPDLDTTVATSFPDLAHVMKDWSDVAVHVNFTEL